MPPTRASGSLLLEGLLQELPQAFHLSGREALIRHQVREQQLGGAAEELSHQVTHGALSRDLLGDERGIPMPPPVSLAPHESLLLEYSEHRQYRVVGERILEFAAHIAHAAGD